MHRSGTSAITCLLEGMGFHVGSGDELLDAGADNPDGFWERKDVVRVNKKMLRQCNCRWDMAVRFRPDRIPAGRRRMFHRAAGSILDTLKLHEPWAVKDPRMCLLLPLWMPLLEDTICLVVARHPGAVADSLNRRDGIPHEAGAALWELYMVSALGNSHGMRSVFVSFDRMLANPAAEAAALFDRLSAAGCRDVRHAEAGEVQACVTARPAGGAAGAAVVLTPEQERLWGALQGGTPRIPVLSEHARRALVSYERSVVAGMRPGERLKRWIRSAGALMGLPWMCGR
jgi:hypothetical protein